MNELDQYYQLAKIKGLSPRESELLATYAIRLGLEPERVLINKSFFESIAEEYQKHQYRPDETLLHSLREKLGFTSIIGRRKFSTKEISKNQKAKFYFEPKEYVPITLLRHHENYNLWRVELHGNMNKLHTGMEGYAVFEEAYSIAYKFQTLIQELLIFYNETLIKLPQSNNLVPLAKRHHPRIDVQIPATVKKEGKIRENPYHSCIIVNLSEGGARIRMKEKVFFIGELIEIRFKLDYEHIQSKGEVVAQITYEKENECGLKFINLDPATRFLLANYVTKYSKE